MGTSSIITPKFAFESAAREFYEEEGRAIGYDEPYLGGDGWWKCTRYTKAAA